MLSSEQTAAVERLVYDVEVLDERLKCITGFGPYELDYYLDLYNWDDGFEVPTAIASHPACDEALALKLFWRAGGIEWYSNGKSEAGQLEPWSTFCRAISERILSGGYTLGTLSFDPELSRIDLFQLRKMVVPERLYRPVVGSKQ